MNRTLIITGMLITSGLFSGCASIVNGQNQSISIDTPGCSPANCRLTNDKGTWFVTTPGSVTVKRAFGNMTVVCTKEGFSPITHSVGSSTKPMAFGNIFFGGAIGAGVDISTGAAYDYPELIDVPLACGPAAKIAKTSPIDSTDAPPNSAPLAIGPPAK